jgi:AcrR family transcriptional regulator
MAPRTYRSTARTAAREHTRERIVTATAELHREFGILDTTHAMVAERADVSIPTVYNHFPTRDDLVKACGTHVAAGAPSLALPELESAGSLASRAAALVRAVFDLHAYYAPWFVRIVHEASKVPELARTLEEQRIALQSLLARLFRARVDPAVAGLAEALIDFSTWKTLVVDRAIPRARAEAILRDTLVHLVRRTRRSKESS